MIEASSRQITVSIRNLADDSLALDADARNLGIELSRTVKLLTCPLVAVRQVKNKLPLSTKDDFLLQSAM